MLLAPPSKSVPKVSSTPRSNQEIVTSQEPPQNMPQVPRRPLQQPKVLEPKAALLLGHHQVPPVASPKVCTTSVSSYTAFLLPCKQINQSFILYIIVILVHISVLFVFYFFLSFFFLCDLRLSSFFFIVHITYISSLDELLLLEQM